MGTVRQVRRGMNRGNIKASKQRELTEEKVRQVSRGNKQRG